MWPRSACGAKLFEQLLVPLVLELAEGHARAIPQFTGMVPDMSARQTLDAFL